MPHLKELHSFFQGLLTLCDPSVFRDFFCGSSAFQAHRGPIGPVNSWSGANRAAPESDWYIEFRW